VVIQEEINQVLEPGDICTLCGKVHVDNFIFTEPKPWEVVAPFVGAAVPGNGFFVIPNIRNAAPKKEIYQAIVELPEGNASAR
jgi:hypothetical protein